MSSPRSHFSGTGPVAEFERRLEDWSGAQFSIAMPSASTALLALGFAAGLPGGEFITTPYTYGATVGGWMLSGARPVFADIEADTMTLSAADTARRLTPKTRAILSVDIHGTPADDQALREVADQAGIWYFSDGAQSLGASREGRQAGSLADAVVLSFTAGKALDVGEGGAILTSHSGLYERLLWLSQHPDRQKREIGLHATNEIGINARMHPIVARLALRRFDAALDAVKKRQRRCREVVRTLEETGLVRRVDRRSVRSSFYRLSLAWNTIPQPAVLQSVLAAQGWRGRVSEDPVRLLYEQPSSSVMAGMDTKGIRCPVAEREVARRFCVELLTR